MSIWRVYDGVGQIIVEGENAAANVHDNDTSTFIYLYNPMWLPELSYIVEQDFQQPITVTRFAVYLNSASEYDWCAVEYWTGSQWALVGYAYYFGWNYFDGNWNTSKWRVRWEGDTDYGYIIAVGEMQAITSELPTTINVSDSGVGVEGLTFTRENLTDTGIGSETLISSVLIEVLDEGSGQDFSDHIIILTTTDSGWGLETPSLNLVMPVSDIGSGVELFDREFGIMDGGGSVEVLSKDLDIGDFGSGVEELPFRSIGVIEAGVGLEESLVLLLVTDRGTGKETLIATNYIEVKDEGFGAEKPLRIVHVGTLVFLRP